MYLDKFFVLKLLHPDQKMHEGSRDLGVIYLQIILSSFYVAKWVAWAPKTICLFPGNLS